MALERGARMIASGTTPDDDFSAAIAVCGRPSESRRALQAQCPLEEAPHARIAAAPRCHCALVALARDGSWKVQRDAASVATELIPALGSHRQRAASRDRSPGSDGEPYGRPRRRSLGAVYDGGKPLERMLGNQTYQMCQPVSVRAKNATAGTSAANAARGKLRTATHDCLAVASPQARAATRM
jgi:hypothetical protein